ncbi:hypothetical protein THIOM_004839 [Candidatus Thiomargarita nelsonii]|uniref:Uncharacterized protein n=1 Tax=Candidatus Thiomargarita nelsonii TaxID=1003181 RepID=A0A176RUV5_9GAMM|nr:hypothetical protein THIOM_004839 [Candidatus Thiomargarita nelsonii]
MGILLIMIELFLTDWWESQEPIPEKLTPLQQIPDNKPAKINDIVSQLKRLHNPDATFTIDLWFDERRKTRFISGEPINIYYKIKGLNKGTRAYLTLLNVSPAGKLSLIFNEFVEVGKEYGSLQAQENVTTVMQIALETGQEYFKAIVTSEPIEWKAFIAAAAKGKPRVTFWGTKELIVDVE